MSRKKTILVIEDNPYNREIAVTVLKKEGYTTITAQTGREGLEKIMEKTPDLVLLDLALPEMTGWEVVKEIRNNEEYSSLPVIALTAHAMSGDRKKALQSGCSSYISKPCRPGDISGEVKKFI